MSSGDVERIPRDKGGHDGKHEGKNDQDHGQGLHDYAAGNQHRFPHAEAAAQSDQYPKMAPVDQYLMERNAEILLARSAAPDSISSDATILILGRQGYLPSHVHNFADSEQRGSEGGTGAPTPSEQSHYAGSLRSGGYAEQAG